MKDNKTAKSTAKPSVKVKDIQPKKDAKGGSFSNGPVTNPGQPIKQNQ